MTATRDRAGTRERARALDPTSWLAYVYSPVLPLLKKVRIKRRGSRRPDPSHILLPRGYAAEVVATGFSTPVHCCFDDQGACYVIECGHKIEAKPRILKVDVSSGAYETFFEWPESRWRKSGAVTGACWHQGYLYVMNTDTLSRIGPDGRLEDLVTGLPGLGDHQPNYPVVGPDGKLYFGMGSATNAGVVGADNMAFDWLKHFPDVHDVPAENVTLAGRNYPFQNVLGNVAETVYSGAFVPFGVTTEQGQMVRGDVRCNGAVLRCNLDGSGLEVVAWGLRNPYGLAFHPDGRLFATEHGIDERGARFIRGDRDDLYEIQEGAWYGWPDFASGIRLDDPYWGEKGQGREPVLARHPTPEPPKPIVTFEPHAAANGVSFSRSPAFGFEGDAFVALFGDFAPVTAPLKMAPSGFKVVRVDLRSKQVLDFAVSKIAGPASKLPHEGFERPSHCSFGPDDALYVVDWGEIQIAPEVGGARMVAGTGVLWRIRRVSDRTGNVPPRPTQVPFYLGQYVLWAGAAVGIGAAAAWLIGRLGRGRRNQA